MGQAGGFSGVGQGTTLGWPCTQNLVVMVLKATPFVSPAFPGLPVRTLSILGSVTDGHGTVGH